MAELAYVNGTFGPISEATIPIEDRGFQFGDGIYEVVVAYDGKPFLLAEHIARLRRSASAILLDYDFERAPLEPIILEGLRRSELRDAMIYLQLTRGVAPRSHVIPPGIKPTVVMTFKPLPKLPDELRKRGARMITVPDIRWSHCFVKAITLLPNILARNEAVRRGYDDAIFVAPFGEVHECTSSNIFLATGKTLSHPPRTESILHGVTQGFLAKCAQAIGLAVVEERVTVDDLYAADEVFISATTTEVLAVTSIDDRPIGGGQPGPIAQRLYDEFIRRARGRNA